MNGYQPRWVCTAHNLIGFYSNVCPSCVAGRPPVRGDRPPAVADPAR